MSAVTSASAVVSPSARPRSGSRARSAGLLGTACMALLVVGGLAAVGPTTTTTPAGAAAVLAPGGSVQWRPEGRTVLGHPVLYRGSAGGVELAWLDPNLVETVFVPGTGEPGGPWAWGGQVAPEVRSRLIAAFNGGFQLQDLPGGFLTEGRTAKGLVPGQASVVIYRDGHLDVGEWGRQVDVTSDVVSVRQNLGMLVDDGRPTPAAANPGAWGGSVAGVATARSSIGVDANGGIILAQARVSPAGLADAQVAAGAVRAMELDINPDWTALVVYDVGADGSVSGRRVMGSGGPAGLYLAPYRRDFFAVLVRPAVVPGGTATLGQPPVSVTISAPRGK